MASIADVVKRLLEVTTAGRLKWQHMDPPESIAAGTDSRVFGFFGATFKGRNIGVYEERYRGYDGDSDTHYWNNRIVLTFFDADWNVGWEAPASPAIGRLYDAIKYQKADVDAIMDAILSPDVEK